MFRDPHRDGDAKRGQDPDGSCSLTKRLTESSRKKHWKAEQHGRECFYYSYECTQVASQLNDEAPVSLRKFTSLYREADTLSLFPELVA